jgi:hypothetical protein
MLGQEVADLAGRPFAAFVEPVGCPEAAREYQERNGQHGEGSGHAGSMADWPAAFHSHWAAVAGQFDCGSREVWKRTDSGRILSGR